MTDYYCDLDADFDNPANVGDATDNPALGPGGLQSMIEGWGNHDALTPSDTLYAKGTGDLSKLVKITVDVDKSGTWAISDVVENHNDGGGANGDDWVGELVYINATTLWVQINAASTDIASVDTADGVYNVSQTDEIAGANMTAAAAPGIQLDNNSGSDGSPIRVVGCADDASFTVDGTPAVLDGDAAATYCLNISGPDYWEFRNVRFTDSLGDAVHPTSYGDNFHWHRCDFDNAGGDGMGTCRYSTLFACRAYDNDAYGFDLYGSRAVGCQAYNNALAGFAMEQYSTAFGCWAWDNRSHGFHVTGAPQMIAQCVAHANDASGVYTTKGPLIVVLCRLTANADYGIATDATATAYDLYNALIDNVTGTRNGNVVLPNDLGSDTGLLTGTQGYEDAASGVLNLRIGAAGYRTEIDLGGGQYLRAPRGLPAMILPRVRSQG